MTLWDHIDRGAGIARDWINGTSMTSVRSLALTVVASLILLTFTIISCSLLLDHSSAQAVLNPNPSVSAAARTTEASHHGAGKDVANLIFAFLTAALVTGVASQATDRFSSREHAEAKERGRITGAAIAASMAGTNGNGHGTTTEHSVPPAATPQQEVNVNVGSDG